MGRESITLAGFRLTSEEWEALDADTREELVTAVLLTPADALGAADPYDSYELFDEAAA